MTWRASELKALLLAAPRLTLAAAESLTCGRIQSRVGEISGASGFFRGGITAYTLDEKVRHLGVDRSQARRVNAVSSEIAAQMAQGACRLFGADVGVATTGYAEPAPEAGIPGPFAWWALAHRRRGRFIAALTGRVECPGATRIDAQQFVADAVLAELVAYLEGFRSGGGKGHGTSDK